LNQFAVLPLELLLGISFVLGAVVGSFLNVVIYRLPKILDQKWSADCRNYLELETGSGQPSESKISLLWPSSSCPKCRSKIRPWHNIPILGFILLKGKCNDCGESISPRYPIVELISALLSVAIIWKFGATLQGLTALGITWALIALTGIDFDEHLLPDSITLPLMWAGLIANSFGIFTDLQSALWGAILGYMSLWTVYQVFKLITGKEGMGFGDFKLLAALGAWLGWTYLPTIILLSSLVGLIFALLFMIFSGNKKSAPIAFGPYLAVAGWICLFLGPDVFAILPI
jgi:leader peptidase (prepilin peptidase) / N-methyltransferase